MSQAAAGSSSPVLDAETAIEMEIDDCIPSAPLEAALTATEGTAAASPKKPGSDLLRQIEDLRDAQKNLKEQKTRCAKDMKNAMKKKKRIQNKAVHLTDSDLVEVLRMRRAKKESEVVG